VLAVSARSSDSEYWFWSFSIDTWQPR